MQRDDQHDIAVRRLAAEVIGLSSQLQDGFQMRALLADGVARRRVARAINDLTAKFANDVPMSRFAGVVNEFELRTVRTGRDLLDLLFRHVNGELEDDTYSAW